MTLQNERARQFEFRPGQLRPQGEQDPVKLYERREFDIHDGDRIRWTVTDHRRGLLNADQARIIAVDAKGVNERRPKSTARSPRNSTWGCSVFLPFHA